MWKEKATDYRRFRLDRLNTPEFKHLKYLLFWPVYGFFFLLVERLWIRESYTPIHCPLDDRIPFCEYFLIPYLLWFIFLIGIQIYTLLYDTESFKKFMKFIMVSYSLAIIIYMLFPNCQELRPMVFERDNIFTKFLEGFYQFDTNTFLSECLYSFYGCKTVILIDEYDVPLENAYFNGFYDRMVVLIRSLFKSALKTNDTLEFVVVTGCLRISKESIFTRLNI